MDQKHIETVWAKTGRFYPFLAIAELLRGKERERTGKKGGEKWEHGQVLAEPPNLMKVS